MLRTKDLRDWFASEVPGIPGSMDGLPEMPHRAFAVSISGGLGLETEGALDRPSFTLLIRGVSGADAEEWAYALDEAWLNATDIEIGDYVVRGTDRLGGPPSYVATDDQRRVVRSATYWCRIAR